MFENRISTLVYPEWQNVRLRMDGLQFLSVLQKSNTLVSVAFLDPQYRGVLEKLSYGNEGKGRGRRRCALQQMTEDIIRQFICNIDRILIPSGHLFLWIDKFHLCEGIHAWLYGTKLDIVDMITWNKGTFGMGYRTRRCAEYCVILQKKPRKAKGIWQVHNIPDVYQEVVVRYQHPHAKPVNLQGELIAAVSHKGDFVIDPAAGSFSVLEAAKSKGRIFLGCDING